MWLASTVAVPGRLPEQLRRLVSLSGAAVASFQYDGLGRRIGKTIAGTATGFLYDGINPVQELSGSTPKANLLTGLRTDEMFSRTDASGTSHFLSDALGSTLALTDGAGTPQTNYSYEPYGKTTASGNLSDNSIAYTGRENDNTSLYYYRARYYHPGLQRFISEDPIGLRGGVNQYGYVGGNPISRVDPFGLRSFTFGAYYGAGFQVTFGNDNGNGFMTFRVGFGYGGGYSYDPNGGIPGPEIRDRSTGGIVLSDSFMGNFSAGPITASVEKGVGRNYSTGESSKYGGPSYGTSSPWWGGHSS